LTNKPCFLSFVESRLKKKIYQRWAILSGGSKQYENIIIKSIKILQKRRRGLERVV
jgi:hypothetical protein